MTAFKIIHLTEMHMAWPNSSRGCTEMELPLWRSCWSGINAMVFIWSCPEASGMGEGSTLSNAKWLVAWVWCEVVLNTLVQDMDFRKNVLSGGYTEPALFCLDHEAVQQARIALSPETSYRMIHVCWESRAWCGGKRLCCGLYRDNRQC